MRDSSAARGQCNVEFECASGGGRGRTAVLTGSKYLLALMEFGDPRLESLEDWSLRKSGYCSPGLPETARPNLRRARVEQILLTKAERRHLAGIGARVLRAGPALRRAWLRKPRGVCFV